MSHLLVHDGELHIFAGDNIKSPSYADLLYDFYHTLFKQYHLKDGSRSAPVALNFINDLTENFNITPSEVLCILLISVVLTWIRSLFEEYICKPFIHSIDLTKANRLKFPESAWKSCFYSFTWLYCLYLVVYRYDYFNEPYLIWDDWSPRMIVPIDIKLLYFIECGFYIHSIYATIYMDSIRKDFYVMLLHHVLTIALISISYATRYHKVGTLVLFVHDVTDIPLEMTKLMRYLSVRQNGRRVLFWDFVSQVGFVIFTCCWLLFRLYWYPLKILYTTGVVIIQRTAGESCCCYGLFNGMLWILMILNVYWTFLILRIVFKVLTCQPDVNDIRENEAKDK